MLGLSLIVMNPIQAWALILVIPFILGIISIFYFVREITHDKIISLFASLQFGTSNLILILFSYGYAKQMLGIALIPLAVLFFHRSLHENTLKNKLITGILFGVIGLTHEIAFVSLLTFFLVLIGFKMGVDRKIPFWIINRLIIITIPAVLICGSFYVEEVSAIIHAGGESISEYSVFYVINYGLNAGMLAFALVGLLAVKHHKYLVYSLFLSGLILLFGWVGYQDRFMIQMIIPLSILSGYGFKQLWIKKFNLFYFLALFSVLNLVLLLLTPSSFINQNFDYILLPISMISVVFTGWFSVVLKFVIGIPLTIALWVLIIQKLKYYIHYIRYTRWKHEPK